MDFTYLIIVEFGAGMLLLAGAGAGGGHYRLVGTLRQRGNVPDLSTLEQGKAIHNVKVLTSEE